MTSLMNGPKEPISLDFHLLLAIALKVFFKLRNTKYKAKIEQLTLKRDEENQQKKKLRDKVLKKSLTPRIRDNGSLMFLVKQIW